MLSFLKKIFSQKCSVAQKNRVFLFLEALETRELLSAPAAILSLPAVVPGRNSLDLSVIYRDDQAINVRTLDSSDIRVVGPGGYNQAAALVNVSSQSNGPARTATYRIAAPGGIWDAADNGNYQVVMQPNQVKDTNGNAVPAGTLGTVKVNIAQRPTSPEPLTATAVSSSRIDLSWRDSAGETGYRVYQWTGSNWRQLVSVAANTTSYSVSNLSPATTYYFYVEAYNNQGRAWTNWRSATTFNTIRSGDTITSVQYEGSTIKVFAREGTSLSFDTSKLPPGNGASVPWDKGWLYPWRLDLQAYKNYLDTNFREAFQLHDYLYSKKSTLDGVDLTRAQADLILKYSITAKGEGIHANIVYLAVYLGGASHWKKA